MTGDFLPANIHAFSFSNQSQITYRAHPHSSHMITDINLPENDSAGEWTNVFSLKDLTKLAAVPPPSRVSGYRDVYAHKLYNFILLTLTINSFISWLMWI